MRGFLNFIREQGVIGLAVGFLLGGAVSKLVTSLVTDIINPLLGPVLGAVGDLKTATLALGPIRLLWGDFLGNFVDFTIVAAVVYFVVHGLGLDRLDRPKPVAKK